MQKQDGTSVKKKFGKDKRERERERIYSNTMVDNGTLTFTEFQRQNCLRISIYGDVKKKVCQL